MNDYRQKDIRKSKFVVTDAVQSGDYFDVVRSSQNLRISFSDLVASLGVTGTLQTRGEVSGTPVLYQDLSDNYIRNMLGGSGISTSLSVGDAVQLDHNFQANKDGVPVLINEGASSPIIRSIQAGDGIAVSADNGSITISESGVPATTKTVTCYDIGDFPTPIGDVITLAADTMYFIANDISSANRFIMNNSTVIKGSHPTNVTLEYTGTEEMFTSTDVTPVSYKDLTISAPNGDAFAVPNTVQDGVFSIVNCVVNAENFGTLENVTVVNIQRTTLNLTGDGITFSGTFLVFFFDISWILIPSGTGHGIDLGTATFQSILISESYAAVSTSGSVINGAADSANLGVGGLATVQNVRQFGTADALNGIDDRDDLWEFSHSADVPDSINLELTHNTGDTYTITTINTPVKIDTSWVIDSEARFTGTAAGVFTYNGRGTQVLIDLSLSSSVATGSDTFTFYIYINGVQITESGVTRTIGTEAGNISVVWSAELATDDYIEVWVENNTGTRDLIVATAQLRIAS